MHGRLVINVPSPGFNALRSHIYRCCCKHPKNRAVVVVGRALNAPKTSRYDFLGDNIVDRQNELVD